MKDLTLTQEYLICAVNDKGVLSSYNLDAGSCLIASGILEMQMEGCISIQEKKVSVCGELPEKLKYLQPLYNVIHQGKPVKLEKILDTYMISFTNKKLNELVDSIMNALKEADAVTMVKAGILGNKENYAPKKESVNRVIDKIRAELLEDGEITEVVIALTALLEKRGVSKNIFPGMNKNS